MYLDEVEFTLLKPSWTQGPQGESGEQPLEQFFFFFLSYQVNS